MATIRKKRTFDKKVLILKQKVGIVKPYLISNGLSHVQVILDQMPELDTLVGGKHIENVWRGGSSNEQITEILVKAAMPYLPDETKSFLASLQH